jgi:hypothetical protein
MRYRWGDLSVGRDEPNECLPELPARYEYGGMGQPHGRNELCRWQGVQPSELHSGLLHQRDGLRVRGSEPDEHLPKLSAWQEHGRMDRRGERNELSHRHLLLCGLC